MERALRRDAARREYRRPRGRPIIPGGAQTTHSRRRSPKGPTASGWLPAEGSGCTGSGTSTIVVAIRFRSSFAAFRTASPPLQQQLPRHHLPQQLPRHPLPQQLPRHRLLLHPLREHHRCRCISVRIRDPAACAQWARNMGSENPHSHPEPICHVQMTPKAVPARPVASAMARSGSIVKFGAGPLARPLPHSREYSRQKQLPSASSQEHSGADSSEPSAQSSFPSQ